MPKYNPPRRCWYKGKPYNCVFIGATKRGDRACLRFLTGNGEFWVDGSAVSFAAPSRNGQNNHTPTPVQGSEETAPVPPPAPVAPEAPKTVTCRVQWLGEFGFVYITGRQRTIDLTEASVRTIPTVAEKVCSLPAWDGMTRDVEFTLAEMREVYALWQSEQATEQSQETVQTATEEANGSAPDLPPDDGEDAPDEPTDVPFADPANIGTGAPHSLIAPVVPSAPAPSQVERVYDAVESQRAIAGRRAVDAEGQVNRMARIVEKIKESGGLYIVNYYIPDELSKRDPDTGIIRIPSPAAMFHRYGIDLDGSNKLLTKDCLESEEVQNFFALMDSYSGFVGRKGRSPEYWTARQHEDETAKFVAFAEKRLCERVRQIHSALIQGIATADENLKRAQELVEKKLGEGEEISQSEQKAADERTRHNTVRAVLKRIGEDLNHAIQNAERYDETEQLADLFNGLRSALRAERDAFNVLMRQRGLNVSDVVIP